MDREPLPLMTGAERKTYCAWLKHVAGNRRGTLPDRLRQAANDISTFEGDHQ